MICTETSAKGRIYLGGCRELTEVSLLADVGAQMRLYSTHHFSPSLLNNLSFGQCFHSIPTPKSPPHFVERGLKEPL